MPYFLILIAASYVAYVLVSETIIPFRSSRNYGEITPTTKHRRRLGYWCAASVLTGGAIVHLLVMPLVNSQALILSFAVAGVLALPATSIYLFKKYVKADF